MSRTNSFPNQLRYVIWNPESFILLTLNTFITKTGGKSLITYYNYYYVSIICIMTPSVDASGDGWCNCEWYPMIILGRYSFNTMRPQYSPDVTPGIYITTDAVIHCTLLATASTFWQLVREECGQKVLQLEPHCHSTANKVAHMTTLPQPDLTWKICWQSYCNVPFKLSWYIRSKEHDIIRYGQSLVDMILQSLSNLTILNIYK